MKARKFAAISLALIALFLTLNASAATLTSCPSNDMNLTEATTFVGVGECNVADSGTAGVLIFGANNVSLDCGGMTLIGTNKQGTGIYVPVSQKGVTIKNCNIKNYYYNIYINGGGVNFLVDNVNSTDAIYSFRNYSGSLDSTIRNSYFSNSTLFQWGPISNSLNSTIENSRFENISNGVALQAQDTFTIRNNEFINIGGTWGVHTTNGRNRVKFSDNYFYNSTLGFVQTGCSGGSTSVGNEISNNKFETNNGRTPIYIFGEGNEDVRNNELIGANTNQGIYITGFCSGSGKQPAKVRITGNKISGFNNGIDISGVFSGGNTISDNNLFNNSTGIRTNAGLNLIYNNFLENTTNASDSNGQNSYNLAAPIANTNIIGGTSKGGNYWHDYNAAGDKIDIENDGFGDTPYTAANIVDNFPLVYMANFPPTADFNFDPSSPEAGQSVAFTDLSSDSDGIIALWQWNFGDGITSTGQNPSHAYSAAGSYTITLTVTDNDGASAMRQKAITVQEPVPQGNCPIGTIPSEEDENICIIVESEEESGESSGNINVGNGGVIIDCMGVKLVGPGTTGIGIKISAGVKGAVIRHCDISKFTTNILVEGGPETAFTIDDVNSHDAINVLLAADGVPGSTIKDSNFANSDKFSIGSETGSTATNPMTIQNSVFENIGGTDISRGVRLSYNTSNVRITGNIFSNSTAIFWKGLGDPIDSSGNEISGNKFSVTEATITPTYINGVGGVAIRNNEFNGVQAATGIKFEGFSDAVRANAEIQGNKIEGFGTGILLGDAYSGVNNIYDNNLAGNGTGIRLLSTANLVYNNFFENTANVDDQSGQNTYNVSPAQADPNIIGGPKKGGNYWSDYTGVDEEPKATGGDGFGDTPYISGNVTDDLPLARIGGTGGAITTQPESAADLGFIEGLIALIAGLIAAVILIKENKN